MKSFDLEKALAGEPVRLRNGCKAYIKYVMPEQYKGDYPLRGFLFNLKDAVSETTWTMQGIHSLGGLSLPINQGWKVQEEYIELFFINLVLTALFNGFNFKECVQHAYNQIKDRKGRMIEGVWVKQEDL